MWIRPDAARFLKPGTDPADVFPGFKSPGRKYSPSQRRIPRGQTGGGRWTDEQGSGGGSGGGGSGGIFGALSAIGEGIGLGDGFGEGFDNFDLGDLTGLGEFEALFSIKPSDLDFEGVQLAGDPPPADPPGLPSEQPPEIPTERPKTSAQRTGYLRAAASWLGRNTGLAADIYTGFMNNVDWLQDYHDLIEAARDDPKPFEELQAGVGQKRPGYDNHHIVEQTLAQRLGFSRSEIDDPSNLVSIPRLKHSQITGWYGKSNEEFGGLSPREYLEDKSWDERMRVGRDAMIRFGVLKP